VLGTRNDLSCHVARLPDDVLLQFLVGAVHLPLWHTLCIKDFSLLGNNLAIIGIVGEVTFVVLAFIEYWKILVCIHILVKMLHP